MTQVQKAKMKDIGPISFMRWDGSADGARAILKWVRENGGVAHYYPFGVFDGKLDAAINEPLIRIGSSDDMVRTLYPSEYIIENDLFSFYPVGSVEFEKMCEIETPETDYDLPCLTRSEGEDNCLSVSPGVANKGIDFYDLTPEGVRVVAEWLIDNANVKDIEDCTACAVIEEGYCPVHYGIGKGTTIAADAIRNLF